MTQNNPNTDSFDGDTLVIIGANGADYEVKGGDPVRDQGFINHLNIALLTEPGWCGNELEPIASRKISSKFIVETDKPINRQQLLDMEKAAIADIKGDEFGDQRVVVTIPITGQTNVAVFVQPPTGDLQTLLLTKIGKSWVNQALNPINERAQ